MGTVFHRSQVDWSVMGTHPLAGRYVGKQKFIDAAFARLAGLLQGGAGLEVQNLLVDGDTVVVELASTSITNEGVPFDNKYCWVCRFDGDLIAEVRASQATATRSASEESISS